MKKGRAPRALTIALSIALALAICLGAAAAIAPANPMSGFAALNTKAAATQTPSHEAVLGAVVTPSPEDEEITADDEAATDDDDDAIVENPTEEEKFLSDLMNELDIDETNALEKVNGMTHILLVGVDARPGQKTGRSDTMMLLTIDAEHGKLKLTSFMRDLYVEIPGRKNNRLNSAYVFGGPELLIKTLKKNFGVNINYYAAVNFSLLADLIDQIGGLEVNIENKTQMKYINLVIKEDNVVLKKAYPGKGIKTNDNLLTKTGVQLLNGRQAQAYARYRKGSSDFERTERQRDVILKAMEKVKGMSMMDLGKLALDNLDKVNTNLTVADILRLAPAAFQLKDSNVEQLRIPVDNGYTSKTISGMAVLVPNRSKNVSAITKFLLK
jgi:LCP family protein required for cell wall assembly